MEAQIQNITPGPIFLEKVNLEPSTKYTVRDLNASIIPSAVGTDGRHVCCVFVVDAIRVINLVM